MSRSSAFLALVVLAASPAVAQAVAEPRMLFTGHNGGCYWIQSRAECCKHKDGRNYTAAGHYFEEYCVPAAEGTTFTSGQVCEPECWVHGLCGDGSPQADRVGRCPASSHDDNENILVVSEDTTTTAMPTTTTLQPTTTVLPLTTTTLQPITTVLPLHFNVSRKDKVIAGAVAGSVGGVALLGGLLGGLITTNLTTTTASITSTPTSTSTGSTTGVRYASPSPHVRFLAHKLMADPTAPHLGSPWMAVVGAGALISAAVFAVVYQDISRRNAARSFTGVTEKEDSTDDESMSPAAKGGPDAFDLIDKNHDGVISKEEFNAAFGRRQLVTVASTSMVAAPVYVLPASQSPQRLTTRPQ